MQARDGAPSLTRRSKKDDVEALLSDFDILDDSGKSIPPPTQGAGTAKSDVVGSSQIGASASQMDVGGRSAAQQDGRGAALGAKSDASTRASAGQQDEASSLLADLDDLVKQRRSATPKHRLSQPLTPTTVSYTSSRTLRGGASGSQTPQEASTGEPAVKSATTSSSTRPGQESAQEQAGQSSSQQVTPSWGGWWSSATKLADQARVELEKRAVQVQTQVTERAKEAAAAAQQASAPRGAEDGLAGEAHSANAKPWMLASNVNTFLKSHAGDLDKLRSDLGKVGKRGWNEILHVVAPPIESHEVLSITLSHDMIGFDGVPDVVFQVLQRVMETHASAQDAEHQLVVNSASSQAVRTSTDARHSTDQAEAGPDMKPVDGFENGWKVAEAKLQELVSSEDAVAKPAEDSGTQAPGEGVALPITKCPLFIRIQPILAMLPGAASSDKYVFIAILLRDTANNLTHRTVSQPILHRYVTLSFEDEPWAEDLLSESLQAALTSVGIEYIRTRMQARKEALSKAAEAVAHGQDTNEPSSAD